MKKIALFGTSADPPTAGHQAILKWLGDRYDYVAVWASNNPLKTHQTPLEHRTEMLKLLIAEIDTFKNNIQLHEELSDRRTLISVQKARKKWGEDPQFILAIGSDLVRQIRRWYAVEELLARVEILVIPRPGYPIQKTDLQALKDLGTKVNVADLDAPEVSSTAYREAGDKDAVTLPVKNYIKRERLYRWQKAARA
ncbi:MAG: nicotinate-nucleotide adenylyltransferase [Prochloraceae cyanobacterium]|nr:nicotinate-nucleotide adenylyltransferase [Prochloraceae cyanobacterium]